MADEFVVPEIAREKTYVGKVNFPVTVPERLVEAIIFPDDLIKLAPKLGLTDRAVKFILSVLHGKWSISPPLDLQDMAIKTGMQYSEMDAIVRDLIDKNYAAMHDRLDLYKLWIVILHVKGIRFVQE
jgi:hypothetical protein